MLIEKLRVKNYKSLEDVEIPLRPLTVFVGPNNSGKSNIFDCLEFVKELAFLGPPAVTSRGGFRDIVWGGDLKRTIDIRLEGRIEEGGDVQPRFKYEVGISGSEIAYLITKEEFTLHRDTVETKLLELTGDRNWHVWSEEDPKQQAGGWRSSEGSTLGISQVRRSQDPRHRTLAAFAAVVESGVFYKLAPSRMGSPGPARKEAYLAEEGENLASVLLSIFSESHKDFTALAAYLRLAVHDIRELHVALTADGKAYPQWREQGLPSDFTIKQWMSSDGTRQLLGLLALRFAPRLPPLLCIEEPDNFIHPGLLELVADLLKSISTKTQVLVSTHSPYLLNQLLPEDLLIVEKKEGKTQVSPLTGKKVREALKVLGLGELWYSGDIGGVP